MNISNTTATAFKIPVAEKKVFKDFRELSFALWNRPELADSIIKDHDSRNKQPQRYGIVQASIYLGRTEGSFRQFLWENNLTSDVKQDGNEYFSEEFLDLVATYGYQFDYARIWEKTGHHTQAQNLRREAESIFRISSAEEDHELPLASGF